MEKSFYYIYYLIDPRTKQLFYIGKGKHVSGRTARWRGHVSEARKWNSNCTWGNTKKLTIIKELLKQGLEPECEIVYKSVDEKVALEKEQLLIEKHGRLIDGSGYLTNLTCGGEGVTSRKRFKEEMSFLRRERMLGKNNPMFGKNHSEKTKKQISDIRKQRIKNGDIVPSKHTKEHKQKLKESNPGGKATSKMIYQIHGETGVVIKEWESARQAAMRLGLSLGNISYCAVRYLHRRTGGYFWRYVPSDDVVGDKLVTVDGLLERLSQPHNPYGMTGKSTPQ